MKFFFVYGKSCKTENITLKTSLKMTGIYICFTLFTRKSYREKDRDNKHFRLIVS